mgnify:CR=1 FL=1
MFPRIDQLVQSFLNILIRIVFLLLHVEHSFVLRQLEDLRVESNLSHGWTFGLELVPGTFWGTAFEDVVHSVGIEKETPL